ncbi:hypothetical protein ACEQ8H_003739 [Pleosporales sp. CAS-2024a]
MSMEARDIVFQENMHVLDWSSQCRRLYARPGRYLQRLNRLEAGLRQQIARIALYTPPGDLDELLGPLQIHYAASWSPVQRLEELRIILSIPYITEPAVRRSRIREENQVARIAYSLRHVDKVVVQNIFYRDQNDFRAIAPGRAWSVLKWEDDDPRLNDDRYELVMTAFAP